MRFSSPLVHLALVLSVASAASCGDAGEESECERLFAEDRGCIADRYGSLDGCEEGHAEVLAAGCEAELRAHDACLVGETPATDACHECTAETEALLACGLPDTDPCAELYFEVDEGCLDRAYEGDYSFCREIYTEPMYEPCRVSFEASGRCLAEIPYENPDSCDGACNAEQLEFIGCLGDVEGG